MAFSVGPAWENEVPSNCMFAVTFAAPPHSVALSIRLGLCRKLLMPGAGRWRSLDVDVDHGSTKNSKKYGRYGLMAECIEGEILEVEKEDENGQVLTTPLLATTVFGSSRALSAVLRLKCRWKAFAYEDKPASSRNHVDVSPHNGVRSCRLSKYASLPILSLIARKKIGRNSRSTRTAC